MGKLTQDDLKYINREEDMLKGNINRMCTTQTLEEFYQMAYWAYKRINAIATINYARLTEQESADDRLLNSDWGDMEV